MYQALRETIVNNLFANFYAILHMPSFIFTVTYLQITSTRHWGFEYLIYTLLCRRSSLRPPANVTTADHESVTNGDGLHCKLQTHFLTRRVHLGIRCIISDLVC